MNAELIQGLKELARERGLSFETILGAVEEAFASAYKAWVRQSEPEREEESFDTRVRIDPETGEMQGWLMELDEEGNPTSETEVEFTDEFRGRVAAQVMKHVMFQKLRDVEREQTYEEFAGREGDIVTGIIQQDSHRYTLLDLGKVEALLPQAEQVPSEPYRHGERLKAYIVEVRRTNKGPQIVVSRTHPGLLKKIFELEVPEVEEGIVEIKAVAREPGHRSKIAVASNEPGVDPVGACVGAKGSRVRMVVNELRGEKIDVVPWSADPAAFVANALQPAKVKEVRIDPDTQTALVIVPDYQLSLAIGKEGQNARLAARLTGWRIDIKSETQFGDDQTRVRPAGTPVVPDADEPATPTAAPEVAAEAGAPTEEPQPAPAPDAEAGEPASPGPADLLVDREIPKGADEYVEAADEGAEPPGPGVNADLAPGPTDDATEDASEDAEAEPVEAGAEDGADAAEDGNDDEAAPEEG